MHEICFFINPNIGVLQPQEVSIFSGNLVDNLFLNLDAVSFSDFKTFKGFAFHFTQHASINLTGDSFLSFSARNTSNNSLSIFLSRIKRYGHHVAEMFVFYRHARMFYIRFLIHTSGSLRGDHGREGRLTAFYQRVEKWGERRGRDADDFISTAVVNVEFSVTNDRATGVHDAGLAVILIVLVGG